MDTVDFDDTDGISTDYADYTDFFLILEGSEPLSPAGRIASVTFTAFER
jgi:hypothetical protein